MSDEFQVTASFVYRLYKASYGHQPTYAEFTADRSMVTGGADLEARKLALVDDSINRASFKQAYPDTLTAAQFVTRLYDSLGIEVSIARRQQEMEAMLAGKSRSQVLRDAVEIRAFVDNEHNPSFVLMQYLGYLRRDPE